MNDFTRLMVAVVAFVDSFWPSPLCDQYRADGLRGDRARDIHTHYKFWWWVFCPVTAPLSVAMVLIWIVMASAVMAVAIPLALVVSAVCGVIVFWRQRPWARCVAKGP